MTEPPAQASDKPLWWVLLAAGAAWGLSGVLPYDPAVNKALCLTLFIGFLWLTEALHLALTALLVPVLALLWQLPNFTTERAFASFADPIVFLFLGGFALAAALKVQALDRKMAAALLRASNGNLAGALLGLIGATAVISMGINNTATTALMLPLALGLLNSGQLEADHSTRTFTLLGVAYAANIGGLGTMVGSAPNAIAARALGWQFNDWLYTGIPMVLLLVPLMVLTLWITFRPAWRRSITWDSEHIPWTPARILTMLVFVCTAAAWSLGSNALSAWGIQSPYAWVAIAATIVLGALRLVSWSDLNREIDWGVLLLFGGGLTLAGILDSTGASKVLGQEIARAVDGTHPLLVLGAISLFLVALTELASNTATAALFIPIFAGVAVELGLPKEALVLLVALCASCGFALPVGTPPNALVYGTGLVSSKDMLKAGLRVDVVCLVVITLWIWLRY